MCVPSGYHLLKAGSRPATGKLTKRKGINCIIYLTSTRYAAVKKPWLDHNLVIALVRWSDSPDPSNAAWKTAEKTRKKKRKKNRVVIFPSPNKLLKLELNKLPEKKKSLGFNRNSEHASGEVWAISMLPETDESSDFWLQFWLRIICCPERFLHRSINPTASKADFYCNISAWVIFEKPTAEACQSCRMGREVTAVVSSMETFQVVTTADPLYCLHWGETSDISRVRMMS